MDEFCWIYNWNINHVFYSFFRKILRSEFEMANIGFGGALLIFVIALIVFGPKKLPELGRAVGSTLREFKQSTKGIMDDDHDKEK